MELVPPNHANRADCELPLKKWTPFSGFQMARPKLSERIGNYGNDFKMKAFRLTFIVTK